MKVPDIEYTIFTDKGSRDINEDCTAVYQRRDELCFVLCDGLGGYGMGGIASQTVTEAFGDLFSKLETRQFIDEAFPAAQDILTAEQNTRHAAKIMKTTAVMLTVCGNKAYIGHVGDSRAYVFGKKEILGRTLDHSIPQMLAITGDIKESEIRFHPERNILLRVMGEKWEEPKQEFMKPIPLRKCRAFLLCSDGFWELIDENEMLNTLNRSGNVNEWMEQMVNIVKQHGTGISMDNYSAIAIRII